jgi:mannonate dehydratase
MRLILGAEKDEEFQYAAQLGCDGIMAGLASPRTPDGYLGYADMVALKSKVESYGLALEGFSTLPWHLSFKWMLGLPGRDEQIEQTIRSIRNMGAAGIPLLVFNVHALRFYRTSRSAHERGGALSSSFEWERVRDAPLLAGGPGTDPSLIPESHRRPISDTEMWANYAYFVQAAVPAAEEAGVKLALHPDDPQVAAIAGVARIMRSPEAIRRALEIAPSDHLGVKFCVGCYAQMGADVVQEIHALAARQKILLVDYRNIRGTIDRFQETFLDNGQVDMVAAMRALVEAGYDGPIGPDHAVHLIGDTPRGDRYWAYAIGYMRALLQALGSGASWNDAI